MARSSGDASRATGNRGSGGRGGIGRLNAQPATAGPAPNRSRDAIGIPTFVFGLVCVGSLWSRRPMIYRFASR